MAGPVVHVAVRRGADRARLVAEVLAAALGVGPERVVVARDARGKPFVSRPQSDLRHSVAHTRDVLLVAHAVDAEVGVDVEAADRTVADWALWRHALTPAERSTLPADESQRTEALLRAWVRKEALCKAVGLGLAVEPASVTIGSSGEIVALPPALGDPSDWSLHDVPLTGLVAAVACRPPCSDLVVDHGS